MSQIITPDTIDTPEAEAVPVRIQCAVTPDRRFAQILFDGAETPVNYARIVRESRAALDDPKQTFQEFLDALTQHDPASLHPEVACAALALFLGFLNSMSSMIAPLSFAPVLEDVPAEDHALQGSVAQMRSLALGRVLESYLHLLQGMSIGSLVALYTDAKTMNARELGEVALRDACVRLQAQVQESRKAAGMPPAGASDVAVH